MLDPWYVTGFCDGEAAFTFSRGDRGTYNLYFSVRQREDNRQVVEKIQEFFGYIGSIYREKGNTSDTKRDINGRPSAYYRITKINELNKVVEHFSNYPLQGNKHGAYLIWCKMVKHKIENFRDTDYDVLRGLAERLATLNQKSRAFLRHKN